jgi:predicted restriction endonuclease
VTGLRRTPEDIRFSKMIRERDDYTCQRCGSKHLPNSNGLHAAHMFSRRVKATRHDPDNAVALCYGCHQFIDSHPASKVEFFEHLLGERFDALAARAHAKRDRVKA